MSAEFSQSLPSSSPEAGGRLIDCDVILILENQYGSAAEDVRQQIKTLKDIPRIDFGLIDYPEITTEADRMATVLKIGEQSEEYRKSGKKVGLINGGGDFTQNIGLEAAMRYGIQTVGLFAGGNVNALAHMANRRYDASNMTELIRNGHPATIHPVEISYTAPDGVEATRVVFAFFGAGVTSKVASKANDRDHREKAKDMGDAELFRREARMTVEAIAEQPRLTIEDDEGQREILDISIINGPKIAKAVRINFNSLTQPRAAIIETAAPEKDSRSRRLGRTGVAMARGFVGSYDRLRIGDKPYKFAIGHEDGKDISVHLEGEPEEVASGTVFEARILPDVVHIQTSRLRLRKASK